MFILSVSVSIGILVKMGSKHWRSKNTNNAKPSLKGFPITAYDKSQPYQTNPSKRSLHVYVRTCCSECCCPYILLTRRHQFTMLVMNTQSSPKRCLFFAEGRKLSTQYPGSQPHLPVLTSHQKEACLQSEQRTGHQELTISRCPTLCRALKTLLKLPWEAPGHRALGRLQP